MSAYATPFLILTITKFAIQSDINQPPRMTMIKSDSYKSVIQGNLNLNINYSVIFKIINKDDNEYNVLLKESFFCPQY